LLSVTITVCFETKNLLNQSTASIFDGVCIDTPAWAPISPQQTPLDQGTTHTFSIATCDCVLLDRSKRKIYNVLSNRFVSRVDL
jgi:hypothetical protein